MRAIKEKGLQGEERKNAYWPTGLHYEADILHPHHGPFHLHQRQDRLVRSGSISRNQPP
jgi:hypothetical protein